MSATKAIRVVIADDTTDIRTLLRFNLEIDGRFEVVGEAADGDEAVSVTQRLTPDLLVLDLAMPNKDGLQAMPEIRSSSPGTKIAILSGFGSEEMEASARASGAELYLEKGTPLTKVAEQLAGMFSLNGRSAQAAKTPQARDADPSETEEEDVLALVSHELRAPLSVIKGFSATLKRLVEKMDKDSIAASAEAIERNADILTQLVDSIYGAKQLEVGSLRVLPKKGDITELVRSTLEDLSSLIRPHPVRLAAHPVLECQFDPTGIRQVLTNLISNAAKFSESDTRIEVEVRAAEDGVGISVSDYGDGVPAERQGELFQRFSRLGRTDAGTGLGLYISRGIALAHGGDLTYERLETGSCFKLSLPQ